ncbi:hypothetical protein BLS_008835 [Venturia inaequalis]|uniref:BTB domain-containing protein n=1 Tax=Venturia inaequalis TaxID=5025 RepID=A0A8H3U4R6_VENIN|nr:hypothetical protein BLS_008835 [Venturia inaequalis]
MARSLLHDDTSEPDWAKFVTVKVGGTEPEFSSQTVDIDHAVTRDFLVHEDLFRANSPFFEAALGRDFIEAHDRIVKLPEHTPEAFQVYLRWVYARRIVIPITGDGEEMVKFSIMCRAYVLGDILQDVDFKDALIDAIIHRVLLDYYWPSKEAKYVYENTIKDAPLRRLLAAMTAADGLGVWDGNLEHLINSVYGEEAQKYNTVEFLCDVMRLMHERMEASTSRRSAEDEDDELEWFEKTCRYHEHIEGKCYTTRIGVGE